MNGPISIDDIVGRVLDGTRKAQRDYQVWADGAWLSDAPEYLMTTCIAQKVAAIPRAAWSITLETNVRQAMRDAGTRGRLRRDLRPQGRFDILLWWGNGEPRAVIEVKHRVWGFGAVRDDLSRLCGAVRNRRNNTFQCGILAFAVLRGDGRRTARQWAEERYDSVVRGAKAFASPQGVAVEDYRKRLDVADGAGIAAALVIR